MSRSSSTSFGRWVCHSSNLMRLIKLQIPDGGYIHNSKESSYDHWKFDKIRSSDNPALQQSQWESGQLSSLTELILLWTCQIPPRMRPSNCGSWRNSVRNPLAHLIKPLMKKNSLTLVSPSILWILVSLAQETGIALPARTLLDCASIEALCKEEDMDKLKELQDIIDQTTIVFRGRRSTESNRIYSDGGL